MFFSLRVFLRVLRAPSSSPLVQNEALRNDLAYCLTFATDVSDIAHISAQLDGLKKQKLAVSLKEMYTVPSKQAPVDRAPLPRTLEDALRTHKSRAVVITESKKPFRVVDVNSCWENLCGYSFVESKGKTLGKLLKGPETDSVATTGLITQLLNGENEAGTPLTSISQQHSCGTIV